MNVPIKPGSEITITAETDGKKPCSGKKKFTFYVYKISDRMLVKQETQGYILHCVTKEFFINQKVRISRSFKGQTPNNIVKQVGSELGMNISADADPTRYNLIVPNWSPITAIEWVSKFAKQDGGGADFVFFQADMGAFKFKSINRMLGDDTQLQFKMRNPNTRENSHKEDEDVAVSIEDYEFLTHHDSIKNMTTGYYGNRMLVHDLLGKKHRFTDFNYGDDISADAKKKPFDNDFFDKANASHISYAPFHQNSDYGITPNETQEEWLGSRKTNVMKLEENRLLIKLPGFICRYEALGRKCEVQLPSQQDIDQAESLDKYFKGEYLITAIKHTFTQARYSMTFELGKKRLNNRYA